MVQKSQMYDDVPYQAVLPVATGVIAAGANTLSAKFVAFTNLIVKSISVANTALATSADVINLVRVTGTGGTNTTTSTTPFGTQGSGAYFGKFDLGTASQVTLNQGDIFWVQHGTDTTAAYVTTVEATIQPLANITV